jgi:hypothetical protein
LRRAAAVVLSGVLALLASANLASGALEPVTVTAKAPQSATTGAPFEIQVAVEAEPGALDIAAAPLRVRVKLAPECGGSFAGTPGPAVLDTTLSPPTPGQPYAQSVSAQATEPDPGTDTICAYLEDAQERQFATDTGAEVNFKPPSNPPAAAKQQCTNATRHLVVTKRNLKPLNKRIATTKRALHKSHTAQKRKRLSRKLHNLRHQKRRLAKQRQTELQTIEATCS